MSPCRICATFLSFLGWDISFLLSWGLPQIPLHPEPPNPWILKPISPPCQYVQKSSFHFWFLAFWLAVGTPALSCGIRLTFSRCMRRSSPWQVPYRRAKKQSLWRSSRGLGPKKMCGNSPNGKGKWILIVPSFYCVCAEKKLVEKLFLDSSLTFFFNF